MPLIGHFCAHFVENWTMKQTSLIDFTELRNIYFLPNPFEALKSFFGVTLDKCKKKCYISAG
jgi:hypothetical protein